MAHLSSLSTGSNFSICSPFPPVIVISPVSETIILCLHETSLVFFPGSSGAANGQPGKNRKHIGVVFFFTKYL
jgi:hypothetical protein